MEITKAKVLQISKGTSVIIECERCVQKTSFKLFFFRLSKEAWLNKLIQQTAAGDCLSIHSEGMQVLCVWNCTKGLFFNVTRYSTLEAYKQEND